MSEQLIEEMIAAPLAYEQQTRSPAHPSQPQAERLVPEGADSTSGRTEQGTQEPDETRTASQAPVEAKTMTDQGIIGQIGGSLGNAGNYDGQTGAVEKPNHLEADLPAPKADEADEGALGGVIGSISQSNISQPQTETGTAACGF